jgi:hypothetical protein
MAEVLPTAKLMEVNTLLFAEWLLKLIIKASNLKQVKLVDLFLFPWVSYAHGCVAGPLASLSIHR